jgi:hypothetical protein
VRVVEELNLSLYADSEYTRPVAVEACDQGEEEEQLACANLTVPGRLASVDLSGEVSETSGDSGQQIVIPNTPGLITNVECDANGELVITRPDFLVFYLPTPTLQYDLDQRLNLTYDWPPSLIIDTVKTDVLACLSETYLGYDLCGQEHENPEDHCPNGMIWNGSSCVCPEGTAWCGDRQECLPPEDDDCNCPDGYIWTHEYGCIPEGSNCPEGYVWNGTLCVPETPDCPEGQEWCETYQSCMPVGSDNCNCPEGTVWNGTICEEEE